MRAVVLDEFGKFDFNCHSAQLNIEHTAEMTGTPETGEHLESILERHSHSLAGRIFHPRKE